MGNSFDPDAYLAQKAPAAGGFNPDAYIAAKSGTAPDKSGYADTQDPNSPRNVPGVFPAQMEHDAWTKAIAEHPNDYNAAKNQVLAARNAYTQSRPAGGIGENIQGASGIVAGTAMAPLGMAQDGLRKAGQSLEDRYPGLSTSLIGGALKMGGYAIPASPKQLLGNEAAGAAIGYAGNKVGSVFNHYIEKAGNALKEKLPAGLAQYVGIPAPITEYVQGRGSKEVFTPQNLEKGAAMANVGEATEGLSAARTAKGEAIGEAENAVKSSPKGDKIPQVRHILEKIKSSMFYRGLSDPRTEELAGKMVGKDSSILATLEKTLEPQELGETRIAADGITRVPQAEKINLRQALNAKKIIDEGMSLESGKITPSTKQLLVQANAMLRSSVRDDVGPAVAKLWDEFGPIADAQEKLQEFTGTRVRSKLQQNAVDSLRSVMTRNPKEAENVIKVLGAGLPGGEAQARNIFNSIAAEAFTTGGKGAPSSWTLKAASMMGLTGGKMARRAVAASENLPLGPLSQGAEGKYLPDAATDLWSKSALPKMKGAKVGAALRALMNSRDDNGQ